MTDYRSLIEEVLLYLLSAFPADSPPRLLEDVVKEHLSAKYTDEYLDGFWRTNASSVREEILAETDTRTAEEVDLRFTILDDIASKIAGSGGGGPIPRGVIFQDALHMLSPNEFEKLSASLLRLAGCDSYWVTPHSHDEGLDAFGFAELFRFTPGMPRAGEPFRGVFLVQAKHYRKEKVGISQVREFVGAKTLAEHRVYSTAGEKYKHLTLRPLSPVWILLVTSGEVTYPARVLAKKAGVALLTSNDLCEIFEHWWHVVGVKPGGTATSYAARLREETRLIKRYE